MLITCPKEACDNIRYLLPSSPSQCVLRMVNDVDGIQPSESHVGLHAHQCCCGQEAHEDVDLVFIMQIRCRAGCVCGRNGFYSLSLRTLKMQWAECNPTEETCGRIYSRRFLPSSKLPRRESLFPPPTNGPIRGSLVALSRVSW